MIFSFLFSFDNGLFLFIIFVMFSSLWLLLFPPARPVTSFFGAPFFHSSWERKEESNCRLIHRVVVTCTSTYTPSPYPPPPSPTLLCGQTKTIQFLVFCLLCFAYILAPWWGIRKHDRAYKEMRMSNTISYLLWRVRPITSQWNLSPTVAKGSALNSTTDREVNRTVTFRFKFLIVDQNQKKHRLLALILTHS